MRCATQQAGKPFPGGAGRGERRCQRRVGPLQPAADHLLQGRLEHAALCVSGNTGRPQPLLALSQQACQQVLQALAEVIAPLEQALHGGREGVGAADQAQHAPRSLAVERRRIVGRRRDGPQGAGHRHGAGEVVVETVDGADEEPLRVLQQPPGRHPVTNRTGPVHGALLVGLIGLESGIQIAKHALAHLGRRLAGKGDGQ